MRPTGVGCTRRSVRIGRFRALPCVRFYFTDRTDRMKPKKKICAEYAWTAAVAASSSPARGLPSFVPVRLCAAGAPRCPDRDGQTGFPLPLHFVNKAAAEESKAKGRFAVRGDFNRDALPFVGYPTGLLVDEVLALVGDVLMEQANFLQLLLEIA